MTTRRTFLTALASLALVAALAPASYADRKDDLKERFRQRLARLDGLKQAGDVGETFEGYVAAVKDKELERRDRTLVDEENADRRELYDIIAKEQGTTAAAVASLNGERNLRKLKKGEWYKFRDRGWGQKK